MERFRNGDRVCFVGDSITHFNVTQSYIVEYYRKNFPEEKIEFYNCGISGGSLKNILEVFDEDTAIYEPTHIVLMIGVNDATTGYLNGERSDVRYAKLEKAYNNYKDNIKKFYDLLTSRGIKLILCTPVPYAEYQSNTENPLRGGYALMLGYANFIKEFAVENGIPLCDYHKDMTVALQNENLYWADGIHPGATGLYYMARTFLASQGFTIGEQHDIPAELKDWYNTVADIRNTKAAEMRLNLWIPDYYSLSTEDRYKAAKEFYTAYENDYEKIGKYSRSLLEVYFEKALKIDELVKSVKDFMKK